MPAVQETIEQVKQIDVDQYKYGFTTDIETVKAPKGLNEDIVRFISDKKGEPAWMLEWRLDSYQRWLAMIEPKWAKVSYPKIDFQDLYYYAAPVNTEGPKSLDEVDPELLRTYEKLGIPLKEQEILAGVRKQGEPSTLEDGEVTSGYGKVAVDAVFDSVSVVTTFKKELAKAGVIFCSISEALREHPELVRKYLGSVVPQSDNYYRGAQLGGVFRWLLRLHPGGRALPDGAFDLLPHQRNEYRPVRAHVDHRRQGLLRLLPGRLHGTDA